MGIKKAVYRCGIAGTDVIWQYREGKGGNAVGPVQKVPGFAGKTMGRATTKTRG